MIGDRISVTILGVRGNQVRIGVHAPADVAIHREEVYDRVQEEAVAKVPEGQGEPGHRQSPQFA